MRAFAEVKSFSLPIPASSDQNGDEIPTGTPDVMK
jgi:hypothetical protein